MERYFEKFQSISYANTLAVDLTQRTVILNAVYNNPNLYYPYDIQNGERADQIADRYYDDQYMTWVMYLTNKVIDPYYDWYVDSSSFEEFIIKKYGSLENAITKIKYFRNNWYLYPEDILSSTYNSLSVDLQKYYEPVPINDTIVPNPTRYKRRQVDWTVKTNYIVSYSTAANSAGFISDEVVNITFNTNETGTGQVQFANSSTVILEKIQGVAVGGTISGSSTLYGRESQTNVVFTAAAALANNIPSAELSFWSPVTHYEYENEVNQRNKSIFVLDKRYATKMSQQLKNLLK